MTVRAWFWLIVLITALATTCGTDEESQTMGLHNIHGNVIGLTDSDGAAVCFGFNLDGVVLTAAHCGSPDLWLDGKPLLLWPSGEFDERSVPPVSDLVVGTLSQNRPSGLGPLVPSGGGELLVLTPDGNSSPVNSKACELRNRPDVKCVDALGERLVSGSPVTDNGVVIGVVSGVNDQGLWVVARVDSVWSQYTDQFRD